MQEDYLECSQCGGISISEHIKKSFFNKVDITTETCISCGKTTIYTQQLGDGYLPVSITKESSKGLGRRFIHYHSSDIPTVDMSFSCESEEEIRLMAMEYKNDPRIDWDNSYITIWNKEMDQLELLTGKKQESYQDFIISNKDELERGVFGGHSSINPNPETHDMPF